MKAQKAKMKGNEGPKGQNERKSRHKNANFGKGKIAKFKGKIAILGQILARCIFVRPKRPK